MEDVGFRVTGCFCNYQENPLGMDETPVFSWKMDSERAGDFQSAYRIVVFKEDKNPVWDSGKVEGRQNVSVPYEGPPLEPRTRYRWRITAWNSEQEKAQGDMGWFETGKGEEPWRARWIGAPWCKLDKDDEAAPYFRKTFPLSGKVRKARLYICGLGVYEAWLEGKRVSDYLLEPAYTKYDATVLYRVYDVTEYLPAGDRATLAVVLGNSWYNCFTKDAWNAPQSTWRGVPRLLCELHMEYEDGTEACICSDTSWKVSKGPIIFNSVRSGEHYDARLEEEHWNESGFDDSSWKKAIQLRGPGGILKPAQGAPVRAVKTLEPADSYVAEEGRHIFDFGQNLAGKAELTADGPAGSQWILRYGEELTEDRLHVDQSHLRCFIREGEFQTDRYIKKSDGRESWSSRFVYHGFRYVEVETEGGDPREVKLTAVVMHTDFRETGSFACSDERLNRIQHLCRWASCSNAMGLPTSDPHREKNAWTGDNGFAAEQLLINFDSFHILLQWLDSVCDCQRADGAIPCVCPSTGWGFNWGNGPDWSLVLTTLPWLLYRHTGNIQILKKYYPYMQKHFEFMRSMAVDGVLNYGIGDWCAPFDGPAVSVNMESFKAPVALTDTACYYEAAAILDRISRILGVSNPYASYKEEIRRTLAHRFVKDNLEIEGDCQTSDGCLAWNHVLKKEEEDKVAERLADRIAGNGYHLDFGVLGQKYVMESLGDHGYTEILYKMLCQNTYPGYLYLAEKGCTTLTECWNLGGSHNHVMFSHVSAILYRYIAGIRLKDDAPGMTAFVLAPSLLTDTMECSYDTPHGVTAVKWKLEKGKALVTLKVPFGTSARLLLPPCVREAEREILLESGTCFFEWDMF